MAIQFYLLLSLCGGLIVGSSADKKKTVYSVTATWGRYFNDFCVQDYDMILSLTIQSAEWKLYTHFATIFVLYCAHSIFIVAGKSTHTETHTAHSLTSFSDMFFIIICVFADDSFWYAAVDGCVHSLLIVHTVIVSHLQCVSVETMGRTSLHWIHVSRRANRLTTHCWSWGYTCFAMVVWKLILNGLWITRIWISCLKRHRL